MPPITYLTFHLLFILPPLVVLGALAGRREGTWWGRRPMSGLAIVVGLALVYTTPWDNLLIAEGVWSYGEGTTSVHLWHAPLGEYLFFVLQPTLTGLWLFQFPRVDDVSLQVPAVSRALGAGAGFLVSGAGFVLLGSDGTLYLGALLFWTGPILSIQWAFGWPYLWRLRRTLVLGAGVPTLYYWLVDRAAIELGIWVLSGEHTTGLALLGLPVEEAIFFLVTNLFTVQALLLYMWLLDRVDVEPGQRWTTAVVRRQPDPDPDPDG